MYDVIVVGGSYAGISAALQLARARRSVLVLDSGQRRNRFASSSHGFLGRDGASPKAIVEQGKAELLAYPTVSWRDEAVTRAAPSGGAFVVAAGSEAYESMRLILATGVVDELPPIPGLAELWGKRVFQCPYCHGYELNRGKLAALATSPHSVQHAALVAEWGAPGQTVFFVHDGPEPPAEELADLASRDIAIERQRVVRVSHTEQDEIAVHLQDGTVRRFAGLFIVPRTSVPGTFARELGCELEAGATGSYYKTDAMKETTTPGVFACGDGARAFGNVAIAVADGALAGVAAHRSLVFPPRCG